MPTTVKYCSECGLAVARRWIAEDQRERYVCQSCGTTHYENPRTIVVGVVSWRDKLLMCRRACEPAIGQWVLPSGFLECGETLEEGAARETFEETGVIIDANALELHSVVNMSMIHQTAVSFRVSLDSEPDLRPGPECLEVAFVAEAEIPVAQFAWFESMGDSIARLFYELRSGEFSIYLATMGSESGEGFRSRRYRITS